jgi:hypothetical protein
MCDVLTAPQVKWKDLATDLNLVPAGLDPERSDPGGGPLRILSAVVPTDQVGPGAGWGACEWHPTYRQHGTTGQSTCFSCCFISASTGPACCMLHVHLCVC